MKPTGSLRVLDSLNQALHAAMAADETVVMVGEDILDPYGGAFKVTKGLSTAFPARVFTTPISEAGITGVGVGLALRGFRPVVELMFGDFLTLAIDQVINQASKIIGMRPESMSLPMVLRAPMGGRRGYGPTHSQTLDRLVLGTPGVRVLACSHVSSPGDLLRAAIRGSDPVVFIENKVLYAQPLLTAKEMSDAGLAGRTDGADPYGSATLHPSEDADLTIVTYGGMSPFALKAAAKLRAEEGLNSEIVVLHQISPLDLGAVRASVAKTRRAIVVEEGIREFGWGAEVAAELGSLPLEAPVQRVGAAMSVIPASRKLEDAVLPQADDIVRAAVRAVDVTFSDSRQP